MWKKVAEKNKYLHLLKELQEKLDESDKSFQTQLGKKQILISSLESRNKLLEQKLQELKVQLGYHSAEVLEVEVNAPSEAMSPNSGYYYGSNNGNNNSNFNSINNSNNSNNSNSNNSYNYSYSNNSTGNTSNSNNSSTSPPQTTSSSPALSLPKVEHLVAVGVSLNRNSPILSNNNNTTNNNNNNNNNTTNTVVSILPTKTPGSPALPTLPAAMSNNRV